VEASRDGIEAIEALRTFKPRVVLTDLEMPNMNGVELTAHLRGREDMKHVPIIMITSRSQDKHRRMAQEAGVDTYMTKPYNDAELLDAIRQAVSPAVAA
jgi:chemosensory pili system protein ChpA (sensor histidine kinase/response regulator)